MTHDDGPVTEGGDDRECVVHVVVDSDPFGVRRRDACPAPPGEGPALVAPVGEETAVGGEVTVVEENPMEHEERVGPGVALGAGVDAREAGHLDRFELRHGCTSVVRPGRVHSRPVLRSSLDARPLCIIHRLDEQMTDVAVDCGPELVVCPFAPHAAS